MPENSRTHDSVTVKTRTSPSGYLGVHLCAHDLPDILFRDLAVVRLLEDDPRSDDFTEFGVGNRDDCRFSDFWGGGEDVLDLDREEVLFYVEVNEDVLMCLDEIYLSASNDNILQ